MKLRILLAALISSLTIAAPLSSFSQECDGNYYTGIAATQHYAGGKGQPDNAYVFKHKGAQRLQKAKDAAENRPPNYQVTAYEPEIVSRP